VRFLLVAENPEALAHQAAEVHGAEWVDWEEALLRVGEGPTRRLFLKAKRLSAG
jgi:hypothetical protein